MRNAECAMQNAEAGIRIPNPAFSIDFRHPAFRMAGVLHSIPALNLQ